MDPSEDSSLARVPCRHCGELHPTTFSHCPQTGRSLTAGRALVGRVIANRYRILALIGEGGMGAVYVAEHLLIGRKVAVKRLHPELAGDEKAVARFQREARAAGSTGHEHVVEVLDLGYGDDGAPYLVMEYLRGRSLAQILQSEDRLAAPRACKIVGQVLAALSSVHACGVVHRDLKPDNILLTRRGADAEFVKVVDFGISKIRQEDGDPKHNLTRTGVMLGTPFYMSPEQARGLKDLDHRVDLYGVGVILYESLAGQLPFDGDNYHQLLQAILSGKHTPIQEMRPDLDPELAEIVERAIHRDRDERFADADTFLQALLPFGARTPSPQARSEPPPMLQTKTPLAFSKTTPVRPAQPAEPVPEILSMPTRSYTPEEREARDWREARGVTPPPKGLAPVPRSIAPTPRRFVAQSPDWREGRRATTPPPSGVRESGQRFTPMRRPSRPEPRPEARPDPSRTTADDTGTTKVKGSLVLAAVDHLDAMGPGTLERALERLPEGVGERVRAVRLPMTWIGLGDYTALLRVAEREIGTGDGALAIDIGVSTAERELSTTHRLFMRTTTPTMAVERIPQLFRTYHSGGHVEVERAPTGGYRVELFEVDPDTLPHALVLSGFCRRLLELAGGRDVRSSVVACRERGDDRTVTVLRWK